MHLAAFETPLFDEEIVAWDLGPVVESIYRDFKIYNSGAIIIPYNKDNDVLTKDKKDFICNVYNYYGQYSARKLSQMTHEENPWKTTNRSMIITKEKIKAFFQTQPIVSEIAFPSKAQRLKNAALLLLSDYENNKDLTDLTLIDSDDFYEYEPK